METVVSTARAIASALRAHDTACVECRYVNRASDRCPAGQSLLISGRTATVGVTLRKVTDRDIPGVVRYVASEYRLDGRRTAKAPESTELINIFGEGLDQNDLCTLEVIFAALSA